MGDYPPTNYPPVMVFDVGGIMIFAQGSSRYMGRRALNSGPTAA